MPNNKYQQFQSIIQNHPKWFGPGGIFGGLNEDHIVAELFSKYIYDITPTGGQLPQSKDVLNVTNFLKYLEDNKSINPQIERKIAEILAMRDPRRAEITDELLIQFGNLFFEFYDELGFEENKDLIPTKYESLLQTVINYRLPSQQQSQTTQQTTPQTIQQVTQGTTQQPQATAQSPEQAQSQAKSQSEKEAPQTGTTQKSEFKDQEKDTKKDILRDRPAEPASTGESAASGEPNQAPQQPQEQEGADREGQTTPASIPPQAAQIPDTSFETDTTKPKTVTQTEQAQQTPGQVGMQLPAASTRPAMPGPTTKKVKVARRSNVPQKQIRRITPVQELTQQGVTARKRVTQTSAQRQQQLQQDAMARQTAANQMQTQQRSILPSIPFTNQRKQKSPGAKIAGRVLKGSGVLAALGTGAAMAPDSSAAVFRLIITLLF